MHSVAEKMHLLERPAHTISNKNVGQWFSSFWFWKYKAHADGYSPGFLWAGASNESGLSTTATFGDLSGYFFGIFWDKASNITWRYAAPCRPVIDCKMNDLEWPWADVSTNLQFSRCYIFVSFGNNVDIGLHYDNNPFQISADSNKDDLERPWTPYSS